MFADNELFCVLNEGVPVGQKYPESVRHFCLSLYYHSPRAYETVRNQFNNHLPHSKTIKAWYGNFDANAEPGLQQACLDKLKKISEEYEIENNHPIMCGLVYDEVNIRKKVYWCWQKQDFAGYINYGQNTKSMENTIAKQAIVFILNGVNTSFESPICYHFIDSLDKFHRRDLINQMINAVTKCGVKITNITFDGHTANIPACVLLGANLTIDSLLYQPYILNATNGERIYIIFDPCHAEKLVRNALASKKVIYDENGGKIEWRYFVSLYEVSKQNKLRTHKLTKKHMQWERVCMNVRIANETMSNSVANSLQFMMDQNHLEFIGAEVTIKLVSEHAIISKCYYIK